MASNRLYWLDCWLWPGRKWCYSIHYRCHFIQTRNLEFRTFVGGLWTLNSPDAYSSSIYNLVAMTACMMVLWFLVLRGQRPGHMHRLTWWILQFWMHVFFGHSQITGTYSWHRMAWPSSRLTLPLPNYEITRLPSLIMSTLTIRCSLISVLTR